MGRPDDPASFEKSLAGYLLRRLAERTAGRFAVPRSTSRRRTEREVLELQRLHALEPSTAVLLDELLDLWVFSLPVPQGSDDGSGEEGGGSGEEEGGEQQGDGEGQGSGGGEQGGGEEEGSGREVHRCVGGCTARACLHARASRELGLPHAEIVGRGMSCCQLDPWQPVLSIPTLVIHDAPSPMQVPGLHRHCLLRALRGHGRLPAHPLRPPAGHSGAPGAPAC